MKSRWYLAAFPAAVLACSGEGGGDLYGPAPAYGGSPAAQTGGYANVGGAQSGTGEIDTGVPASETGGAMSVRYGPVSSLGSGGAGR
jgi:hypothetical protein